MTQSIKDAIEHFQCPGCMNGGDIKCFKPYIEGVGCGYHYAGTIVSSIGKIFLGLPKGFNRLGEYKDMKPRIYEKFIDSQYDKFNIPVWKYRDVTGATIVRGISPRINWPFIDIFLEDCMDKIKCLEITPEIHSNMD